MFPSLGVVVELFGRFVTALVDTGAGVSLISLRLLRSFDVDISTLQQDSVRPLLTGVTGQSLSTCGVVSLKFRIGSFYTNHAFIVVGGVTHDLILGSDVLTASGCTLDLSRRVMHVGTTTVGLSVNQPACVVDQQSAASSDLCISDDAPCASASDSSTPCASASASSIPCVSTSSTPCASASASSTPCVSTSSTPCASASASSTPCVSASASPTSCASDSPTSCASDSPTPCASDGSTQCASDTSVRTTRVCLIDRLELPTNHVVFASCSLSESVSQDSLLVTPLDSFCQKHPAVQVGSSLVRSDHVVMSFINSSDTAVVLYPGTSVGSVASFSEVELDAETVCSATTADVPSRLKAIDDYLVSHCSHLSADVYDQLRSLLHEYHDVFSLQPTDAGYCDIYPHIIETGDARPIKQSVRRLPFHTRPALQSLLDDLLERGIISESSSPWAAPIVLVKKPDDSFRLCIDYRKLNSVTVPDAYPLPNIAETLDSLAGCSLFSTLDLATGYWQLAMDPTDKPKTAFTTPLGLYEFNVLPMGCCNGPATFQRVMDRLFGDLTHASDGPVTRVFFDDMAVASSSVSSSLSRLSTVFSRLRANNLKLRLSKCVFLSRRTKFLGVDVSARGIHTSESKIAALKKWSPPKSVSEVREFLGFTGYYRKFVPSYANIVAPLTALMKKGVPYVWSADCDTAFRVLRETMCSAPILAFPDFRPGAASFVLDTDASASGMGAVLSQQQEGQERVIAYASKSFNKAQRNYSVTERELLAVVTFASHFRHYLLGVQFFVRTDHQALKWLHSIPEPTGRKARWLETLADFRYVILHRPGRLHQNADTLSRFVTPSVSCETPAPDVLPLPPQVDGPASTSSSSSSWLPRESPAALRLCQMSDPDLVVVLSWFDDVQRVFHPPGDLQGTSRAVRRYASELSSLVVLEGVLYRSVDGVLQFVVPFSLQTKCLVMVHSVPAGGHFGYDKTLAKCRRHFFWPGMSSSVRLFVQCCQVCAAGKSSRQPVAPLVPMLGGYPGDLVAMDLVGPFPVTQSRNRYLLVCVDYFTRWPEAYPLPDITARTVAHAFVNGWVSRFGAPDRIHSDQGAQFESALFAQLCSLLQVRKSRTTPYHPAGDGLVERMNRTLITTLRLYARGHPESWDLHVPLCLLAYRTAVQKSTGETPASLMFGRELRLSADNIYGLPPEYQDVSTHEYVQRVQSVLQSTYARARATDAVAHRRMKDYYDRRVHGSPLQPGQYVWLLDTAVKPGESRKLHNPWTIRCPIAGWSSRRDRVGRRPTQTQAGTLQSPEALSACSQYVAASTSIHERTIVRCFAAAKYCVYLARLW